MMALNRFQTNDCFYYNTTDNYIQCHDSRQREIRIATDDIVCIIPKHETIGNGYTMLFLGRRPRGASGDLQDDCERLESVLFSSLPPELLSLHLCESVPCHLQTCGCETREVHVILSTLSGTGRAKHIYHHVLQPLLRHFGLTDYDVHETDSPYTITDLCRSRFILNAESGVAQTIILLSGDGGLTDIVDTFHTALKTPSYPPTIALIPAGTGNAMASSVGIASRPVSALVTLLRGTPKPIPVFSATFSPGAQYITGKGRSRAHIADKSTNESLPPRIYGAVVISWGMHAALVADSDTVEYRRFGADRFKMAAKELLFPSGGAETHKYTGTVTFTRGDSQNEGERVETMETREHMYLLVTLVPRLEETFVISPESKPLDGCLRMVHFGPLPPQHAMQLMSHAYREGQHVKEDQVYYSEITRLRIDFDEKDEKWRRVCIDGKIVVVEEEGWVEVNTGNRCALNLLVPSDM
ncbi:hypothetical protein P170DRAFT_440921 [Aspergillus steynii IBT 23096]|uniref:DAGKc domain-containing protein n=1 Tax=Aspergillus steynii IBT 23096 TaxID=1392250 RepID=A0A2I2FVL7_9EURO|nr:uncharacterized protein P170DRAFT_440921 [Aspergillus steynii IBT 23096]PLB44671.1 hypothetical protein P170DRAFT_440921 [Aspergillus steynii IBT 23096]